VLLSGNYPVGATLSGWYHSFIGRRTTTTPITTIVISKPVGYLAIEDD
jgi:hypothetical protein